MQTSFEFNMTQLTKLFVLPALAAIFLAGCAQIPLSTPTPKAEIIEKVRASRLAPVNVGSFKPDPKLGADNDRGINVRSNTVTSPVDGSFAQYLRETLMVDLKASGLYDPNSPATLSGFLTESMLDVGIDTAQSSLGARFVLSNNDKILYDKELKASATWPSSFVGAIAIPQGINQYTDLYHKLINQLFDDPDYQKAHSK